MVANSGTQATESESSRSSSLRLEEGVILVTGENVTRLLDFGRGQFYGLDDISGSILTECLRSGPVSAVARVTADYEVDETRALHDIHELLNNLRRKKLLARVGGRTARFIPSAVEVAKGLTWLLRQAEVWKRWVRPRRAQACLGPRKRAVAWLLVLSWISLRVLGWSASIALFRGLPGREWDVLPEDRAGILDAVDRVVQRTASTTFLLPAACKERALVAQRILNGWYGLPAMIVVGVLRHPFLAHAWVECDGRVVTDDPDHCEPFIPVLRVTDGGSVEPERFAWHRQAAM
jgi:hypothetical protein